MSPTRLIPLHPRATDKGFVSASAHPGETLARGRQRADSFSDHYTQPRPVLPEPDTDPARAYCSGHRV